MPSTVLPSGRLIRTLAPRVAVAARAWSSRLILCGLRGSGRSGSPPARTKVAAGEDAQQSGEHLGGVNDLPGAQAQAGGGGYGQLFGGHIRILTDAHNDAALPLGGAAFGNELGENSTPLSALRDDVVGPFEGGVHTVAAPNIDHTEPGNEGQPVVAVFG